MDLVPVQGRYVDFRKLLDSASRHNLLDRFQSSFDAFHLRTRLSRLIGDQPGQLILMLKPSPEPDPNHREDRDPEDCHDQQGFLIGEDLDDAVFHINLPHLHVWQGYDEGLFTQFRTCVLVTQYSKAHL